jgi:UDP-N-acetylglucosamine:LPS N-acetylglucosamine transferase
MQAFPGAFPHADVVGNPVRTDVLALPLPEQRLVGRQGPIRVLVVGGSQGARVLNQTMPQVAAKLGMRSPSGIRAVKAASRPCSRPMPTPGSRSIK